MKLLNIGAKFAIFSVMLILFIPLVGTGKLGMTIIWSTVVIQLIGLVLCLIAGQQMKKESRGKNGVPYKYDRP